MPSGRTHIDLAFLNIPGYQNTRYHAAFNRVSYLTTRTPIESGIFNKGTSNDNLLVTSRHLELKTDDANIEMHPGQGVQMQAGEYAIEMHPNEGFKFKNKDGGFFEFKDMDSLSHQILPLGTILMWHGEKGDVPKGWSICDGKDDKTPNLVDKFIMGTSSAVGQIGGAKEVTLTTSQMPSHNHGGATANRNILKENGKLMHSQAKNYNTFERDGSGRGYDRGSKKTDGKTPPYLSSCIEYNHSHGISSEGGGQAHENRPPFYTLFYIMKVE